MTAPYHHFFFFNDTATTEIYTLSLHDALPIWVSIGQERLEALLQCGRGCGVRGHQVHEARGNAGDFGMDGDQFGQELLGAERAESVSTLQLCQMQGHVAACWVRRLVKSALRPRPPGAGCKALNR